MRWLPDPSETSVRLALEAAVPALADGQIALAPNIAARDGQFAASTAVVDRSFVLKFAWSEPAAARVLREARVLEVLAGAAGIPAPALVGASHDPVAFVTRLVDGRPLSFEDVRAAGKDDIDRIATELASFLAQLHEPRILDETRAAAPIVAPEPQARTDAIRERLPVFLDRSRARLVFDWCDWVDAVLARPAPQQVLAHGDLHGYNQIWSLDSWRLLLVADFEVAGPADPEYDFRYFPSTEPTGAFVMAIRDQYVAATGRAIDVDRVMAWHIRTALGDALWRSEADIPLPGGGTPSTYVDDIKVELEKVSGPPGPLTQGF